MRSGVAFAVKKSAVGDEIQDDEDSSQKFEVSLEAGGITKEKR